MNLSIKARALGYKHAAKVITSGRAIPYNLEDCFKEADAEKAQAIADPGKIDQAYSLIMEQMGWILPETLSMVTYLTPVRLLLDHGLC